MAFSIYKLKSNASRICVSVYETWVVEYFPLVIWIISFRDIFPGSKSLQPKRIQTETNLW